MSRAAVALIVLFALGALPFGAALTPAHADANDDLLATIYWRTHADVSVNVSTDDFPAAEPSLSPEELAKQEKANPPDPHLQFMIARGLDKANRGEAAKGHYATAARLYQAASQTRKLTGKEIAEWAESAEESGTIEAGVKIARQGLALKPPDPIEIWRYLANAETRFALTSLLGHYDKHQDTMGQVTAGMSALLKAAASGGKSLDIAGFRRHAARAKALADQVIADPSAGPRDLMVRWLCEFCDSVGATLAATVAATANGQQPPDPSDAFATMVKSPFLLRALEMGEALTQNPALQARCILLRFLFSVGYPAGELGDYPDWPAEAQQAALATRDNLLKLTTIPNPPAEAFVGLELLCKIMEEDASTVTVRDLAAKALALHPDSVDAFVIGSEGLMDEGRWAEAEVLAPKETGAARPPVIARLLAYCQARQGKLVQAEQTVRAALAVAGQEADPDLRLTLADVLLMQKRYDEALDTLSALSQAQAAEPHAGVYYNMAVAYVVTNRPLLARKALGVAREHPLKDVPGAKELNENVNKLWESLAP